VSVAAAREEYGVVLIESSRDGEFELHVARTAKLREELHARRGTPLAMIDRGEGYERMRHTQ